MLPEIEVTARVHTEFEGLRGVGAPGGESRPRRHSVLGTAHGDDGTRQRIGDGGPVSGGDAQVGT